MADEQQNQLDPTNDASAADARIAEDAKAVASDEKAEAATIAEETVAAQPTYEPTKAQDAPAADEQLLTDEAIQDADLAKAGEADAELARAEALEAEGEKAADAADAARMAAKQVDAPRSGIDWAVVVIVCIVIIAGIVSLCMGMGGELNDPAEADGDPAADVAPTISRYPEAELEEGVAAIVNGEVIPEDTVTEYIEEFRVSNGLTDDEYWGKWIVLNGYTMDTLRETVVSMYVNHALLRQAADDLNITVDPAAVEERYMENRSAFENDEQWQQVLTLSGFTEESFREQLEMSVLQEALVAAVAADAVSDEKVDADTLEHIKESRSEYADATSLDEIDPSIVSLMRATVKYYAEQDAFSDYMTAFQKDSDVQISKAPSDVPYSVFLLPYYFSALMENAAAGDDANAADSSAINMVDGIMVEDVTESAE